MSWRILGELVAVAFIVCYIVGVSGFTQSWRDALARWLKVRNLRPLHPFDCEKCMTFWMCLVWCLCRGAFDVWGVLASCLLSALSIVFDNVIILTREALATAVGKLIDRLYAN